MSFSLSISGTGNANGFSTSFLSYAKHKFVVRQKQCQHILEMRGGLGHYTFSSPYLPKDDMYG